MIYSSLLSVSSSIRDKLLFFLSSFYLNFSKDQSIQQLASYMVFPFL